MPVYTPVGYDWTQAIVGDVNGDGLLDVVVNDGTASGITILRNSGEDLLNPFNVATASTVRTAAVGDFDGDGIDDVAIAQVGDTTTIAGSALTTTLDQVSIVFGTSSGPPSDPAPIGTVEGVSQILPAYEIATNGDYVQSPFVVGVNPPAAPTANQTTSVILFAGNTARQIDAPFLLLAGQNGDIDIPTRSAIGTFTARSGYGDISVFARPQHCMAPASTGMGGSTSCHSRLWLLPTDDGGGIKPASLLTSCTDASCPCAVGEPCPTSFGSTMPTFDQAVDGLLVPFTPPGASSDQVALMVAGSALHTFDLAIASYGSNGGFQVSAPVTITGFDVANEALAVAGGPPPPIDAQAIVANVDGKGLDLVLASPTSGILALPWSGGAFTQTGAPISVADLVGACDAKGSDLVLRVATLPSQAKVAAARALDPSYAPPQQTLIAVTANGVVSLTYANGSFSSPTCLYTSTGEAMAPGLAVTTGDFDGDGIEDIAVSQEGGITVYYGDAYAAGAAPASAYASPSQGGSP
jgi:hypothetical protein